MKKSIIVKDARQIMALGGLRGPAGPFTTDTKTIFHLISEGCNVVEVLKDGQEVKLTYHNFDRDLNEELGVNAQLALKSKPVPKAFEEVKKADTVTEKETKAVKTTIIDVCEEA